MRGQASGSRSLVGSDCSLQGRGLVSGRCLQADVCHSNYRLTTVADFCCFPQNSSGCKGSGNLVAQLTDGVLVDNHNRTGYIASNFQLQFDNPPQSGALYTEGFSHCGNDSLALGSSATFWQCASGTFFNLYDRWWAEQCEPVDILVLPCGGGEAGGQGKETVVGSAGVTTTVVIPLSDGQPQVITTVTTIPICQIGDGTCPPFLHFFPIVQPQPG